VSERGHCTDCGAVLEDDGAVFDVAVHDCETGEWLLLCAALPESYVNRVFEGVEEERA
jgi:hypothetical protein